MTKDDTNKLLTVMREGIVRVERTIAETESAPSGSPHTETALADLRRFVQIKKAQVLELEKQLAKGT